MMLRKIMICAGATIALLGIMLMAQENHPISPRGAAATQILGKWVKPAAGRQNFTLGGDSYQGGKWIEITYGRPLMRGRDLWGSGATYGKAALVGTPIWRAGSDVSTQLKTEVPLVINGKTVAPGTYTLFIDLKEKNWTFVVSSWAAQKTYDPNNKTELWGSYSYTPDKDVVRAPMKLETTPHVHEQLTWEFVDMSDVGGAMAISWGNTMASVAFKIG